MAILTEALEKINASLSTAAQVYVKAGIAQNDATIICFRAKYADPRMRPVTMISAVLLREVIPLLMRRHLNVESHAFMVAFTIFLPLKRVISMAYL